MTVHIIIAEDETDVRNFLVRALQRIKPAARITGVGNGLDAWTLFQAAHSDLLISDHRMPAMTGLDLLIAVRRISTIPFIMISADSMLSQHAIAAGVTMFLDKPLGIPTLREAVLQCLPV